ncbi:MAG: Flp pilus assembly complex ATPase component TadA [Proteobacteria bacterium]|jgi:type IV pilus assembly protein PilB|nr:Flp pilus assembly complex ATPase component TadA [Pseudomonadota bacterium]
MSAQVAFSQIGSMTYLAPAGALTAGAASEALQESLAQCIASNQLQVILDLEQVSLVDGRALEIIQEANVNLSYGGGWLKLMNPSALVRDILTVVGLGDADSMRSADPGDLISIGEDPAPLPPRKFGEILLDMGVATVEQIDAAAQLQSRSGKRMGRLLVENGTITDADLLAALGRQFGLPHLRLRAGLYEAAAAATLPREVARRLEVLPLFKVHDTLTLATSDPQSIPVQDEVRELTGLKLRLVLAAREDILKHQIDAYSGNGFDPELVDYAATDIALVERQESDYAQIDQMAGGSPVINLVNGLIQRAVRDGVSDIHIESGRSRSLVRFRIDGLLYEALSTRADMHPAIVSRLKVMANLDIAERRLPQDGRMQVTTQGRNVDLRFSSLPGIYGEKVVLRVLDKSHSILDVEKLGMSEPNLALLKKLLARSYGLMLVTGPTGSGKTTTLYASVNHLKSVEKNIVTIEDPVEYQLDIINQNQVNDAIGLSFSKMLKHVLRQDPDIIMVGEIRDRDTAEIAVQASLTGHLVLSTLHTNDAVGALSRMMDMGVEPYLLSSALAGVIAQRLVRGICADCKQTFLAPTELLERFQWPAGTLISKGRGCSSCYDSGYRGRLGIHEIIESSDSLQRLMAKAPNKEELTSFMKREKYATLFDDGLRRVLEGKTTVEEIYRVIHAE